MARKKSLVGWTRLSNAIVKKCFLEYRTRGILKNSIFGVSNPFCDVKGNCCSLRGKAKKNQWCQNPRFAFSYTGKCRRIKLNCFPETITIEHLPNGRGR